MIIFRYLTREIFAAMCSIAGILLLIFLSNQFVRYLNQAALGKFAGSMLLNLLAIEIPHLLAVLLPLGLFLGILLAYGRLYSDNEMVVLNTCGLSRLKLTALTLPIACVIAAIVALLSLWLNPQLLVYRDRALMQTGAALVLETTLPGQFQESDDGKRVLYVENTSSDHQHMQNLFFAQLGENTQASTIQPWIIVTAQSGYQSKDPKTGTLFFITTNGRRYQGTPGNKDFQIAQFGSYKLPINHEVRDFSHAQETFPTKDLLRPTNNPDERLSNIAELEWRLSLPLSALLLTLLAIPLSRIKPRKSKYSQLLPAILIYATYVNLLVFARNWVMGGSIPLGLGLWWIHGLLVLVIALLWINQTGWIDTWKIISKKKQVAS